MIDEMFDRDYQAARTQMNSTVSDAFAGIARTVGDSLRVLHRIEWSAPWTARTKPARRA